MEKNEIFLDIEIKNKDELFKFIAEKGMELGLVKKPKSLYNALWDREREVSTGLENNIAIPHAISKKILKATVLYFRCKQKIEWKTIDGNNEVNVVICMLVPKSASQTHLKTLQKISVALLKKENQELLKTGGWEDICQILS